MLIRKTFERDSSRTDRYEDLTDEIGWVLKDMPFDVTGSFGMAHDCIEHINNATGMQAEIRASGVAVYGRLMGQYDSLHPYQDFQKGRHKMVESMANDLLKFACDDRWQLYYHTTRAGKRINVSPLTDEGAEDAIRDLLTVILTKAKDEEESSWDGDDVTSMDRIAESINSMVDMLRIGYRNAARRYHRGNHESLASMFYELEKELEDYCGKIDPQDEYGREWNDNDKLVVIIDTLRESFDIRVKKYRDPYDY